MLVTKHACKLSENMDWIDQSLADVEDHLKVSTILTVERQKREATINR